jgi:hypothetical protein
MAAPFVIAKYDSQIEVLRVLEPAENESTDIL